MVDKAISLALADGHRTPDIASPGAATVSTGQMGDAVVGALEGPQKGLKSNVLFGSNRSLPGRSNRPRQGRFAEAVRRKAVVDRPVLGGVSWSGRRSRRRPPRHCRDRGSCAS